MSATGQASQASGLRQAAPILLGVAVGAATAYFVWTAPSDAMPRWEAAALAAAIVAIGAAVMFLARMALKTSAEQPASASSAHDPMRAQIAPVIITVDTVGIVSLAIAVMAFVATSADANPNLQNKLDTILLSVFSTVISVFATWVGTVLAFYFSNESFRVASENAQRLTGPSTAFGDGPITDPVRMIPLDKITAHKLSPGEKADAVPLSKIEKHFGATVSRVPILDNEGRVELILRVKPLKLAKAKLPAPVAPAELMVADYLAFEQNGADARNFRFLSVNATVEDGRRVMERDNTVDIFITAHGLSNEAIKGWITDDSLK